MVRYARCAGALLACEVPVATCGALRFFFFAIVVVSEVVRGVNLVVPNQQCSTTELYFSTLTYGCASCTDLDPQAVYAGGSTGLSSGSAACACAPGLVECHGGQQCVAQATADSSSEETFVTTSELECRGCPLSPTGVQAAPTRDRMRCLPCDEASTAGFSAVVGDCVCPAGKALVERDVSGAYLPAKQCITCADEMLPGPAGESLAIYGCAPCPDPWRMYRDASSGLCMCRSSEGFVAAGGMCVQLTEYDLINTKFPEATAVQVTFRDLVDEREEWWEFGPFGTQLGIEVRVSDTIEALNLNSVQQITITSAMIKWLYVSSAVNCLRGNTSACQCVSNMCALLLYENEATVCRLLHNYLYEGRPVVLFSSHAYGVEGMPWLFYTGQSANQIRDDTSLNWKFTLLNKHWGQSEVTNKLILWLARYSLEGAWLGWEMLNSQLNLCALLGGASDNAITPPYAWMRFGSSLVTECKVPLVSLKTCGEHPVLYELFVENVGGTLVPVPVRILNLKVGQARPNLNRYPEDISNDIFVRRFVLCDAVTGIEGDPEAYLQRSVQPTVFRWVAHAAVKIRIRPDEEGKIYVPVLSLAYAERRYANLDSHATSFISFKAEYSMDTTTYWDVMTAFIVIISLGVAALAAYRIYLVETRYPTVQPPPSASPTDPGIFVPKAVLFALAFFATVTSVLFWFHLLMTLYWFVVFKAQDAPHVLLPSAFEGDQYEPHDALLVLVACTGAVTIALDLYRHLKVFVFLIDWEKSIHPQGREQPWRAPQASPTGNYDGGFGRGSNAFAAGGLGGFHNPGGMMSSGGAAGGGPQMLGAASQLPGGLGMPPMEAPDTGISAWRSLFVCNELNERLVSTRTVSHVTWILMAAFMEGFGWKNGARWYPRFSGDEGMLTAQFNPFLQFALSGMVWLFILSLQYGIRRVGSLGLGDDLNDFVDLCSVANVSVLFLDEPFHGFYIHGKAPSSRGDLCHSELYKAMADENKGIGFSRGLVNNHDNHDACQTFELFLPPDLSVQVGGGTLHFHSQLSHIFTQVNRIEADIATRRPEKPRREDMIQLAIQRCALQGMVDALVHTVMQAPEAVVRERHSIDWFWGAAPQGGVMALQSPIFYPDRNGPAPPNGLAWSSCLAYGPEFRIAGMGFPTGFEWYLNLMEFIVFSLMWRFQGSCYVAVSFAFVLNQLVLRTYAAVGRYRLAHTTIIDKLFLI